MIPYVGKITLDKTIKYIENNTEYYNRAELKNYDFMSLKFRLSEEEISKVLFDFVTYNIELNKLDFVLYLCETLNLSLADNKNKSVFYSMIDLFKKNQSAFPTQEVFDKIISCFNDKSLAVEFLRYIYTNHKLDTSLGILSIVNEYLIKARQYYVDDRALLTSTITLIDDANASLVMNDDANIKDLSEKKLKEDRKANGIYDVDQNMLEEFDRKINEFESLVALLKNLAQMAETQMETIKRETKNSNDKIADIRIQTLKTLKTEADKIITNFNASYLELLNKEKESITNEKDILLTEIHAEVSKLKLELQSVAKQVGSRISIELGRIRTQSDNSIEKMKEFVENNEEVKKIFEVASQDEAFLNRLAKIDSIPVAPVSVISGESNTTGAVIAGAPVVSVPNIIVPTETRIVDEKINYYFDRTVPFKDRFNELMKLKQEDIDKTGAIYHEKFDDLVTMVLTNNTPYMYGPSGCGKTYMVVHQLAKLLGINVVTNGYIMYEADILGFNNANGVYVPSNFYRCYKFGDMIFLDELDNSISSSTIALNSFIGKGENSSYTFPNGDIVKRHPNFRILTAGNTRGNGRTVSHNTRQKLDESVLQRLTPVEIDYDNRIEKEILKDYPEWYDFAINFRTAIKEIERDGNDGPNYNGTLTTRDIESIKRYKEDDCFTDEKIIEYEVIENKEIDYLNNIIKEMESLPITEGTELFEKFKSLSKGRKY